MTEVANALKLTLKPLFDVNDRFYQNFPKFQKYDIKLNGEKAGTLEWKHRPKNCGGYAWYALIDPKMVPNGNYPSGCVGLAHWCKDKDKLLVNVRDVFEGRETTYPQP